MFDRILVPLDGSPRSWAAADIADRVAAWCDADLELVHVVDPYDEDMDELQIRRQFDAHPLHTPGASITFLPFRDSVAATITDHFVALGSAGMVMSSAGRGRSEAVLGSVAEEVLARTFGPIMFVGPECADTRPADGAPLVIPVDGSETSEAALGLGSAWGIAFHLTPWVVWVAEPGAAPAGVIESSYPASLARRTSRLTHRDVEFEVLHDRSPAKAIVDFARVTSAGLIVASTHGRTGLDRLVLGSVAAGIVKHAPCPVVLSRPPHLADSTEAVPRRRAVPTDA
jgi:nucleotide-binding universal stress UspA family protein